MKQKVIDFYESQGLSIIEIIKRGKRKGLHASQVEQALEVVYDTRDQIKPINLARQVWEEAKHLKGESYVIAKGIIDNQRKEIKKLLKWCWIWAVIAILQAVYTFLIVEGVI